MTSERLKGLISDAKQQTVEQVKAFPLTALAHIQGLASVLEALLVDISILRDDQKSAEAIIAELKDNCRCPECGCATIADAESTECGCDAPVCLIEVGDTLAKAYVRLHKEIATLKAEVKKKRVVTCLYCNTHFEYEKMDDETFKSLYQTMLKHDAECAANPNVQMVATLRTHLKAVVGAGERVLLRHDGTFYTESMNDSGAVDALRSALDNAKGAV